MITRIEVDGFKSLRGFALDLEPLTAILGPNGAGKSNILEAMALLSRLMTTDVPSALKGGRGRIDDQFSRAGGQLASRMTFGVESILPPLPAEVAKRRRPTFNRVRYEFVLERSDLPTGASVVHASQERFAVHNPAIL